MLIIIWFCP